MSQIEKINAAGSKWPHNLFIGYYTEEMSKWLVENFGHGDVFLRDEVWYSHKTQKPIEDVLYFCWGPGHIQFKYEQDLISFVLRFSG